jgi:hypothetical protein
VQRRHGRGRRGQGSGRRKQLLPRGEDAIWGARDAPNPLPRCGDGMLGEELTKPRPTTDHRPTSTRHTLLDNTNTTHFAIRLWWPTRQASTFIYFPMTRSTTHPPCAPRASLMLLMLLMLTSPAIKSGSDAPLQQSSCKAYSNKHHVAGRRCYAHRHDY